MACKVLAKSRTAERVCYELLRHQLVGDDRTAHDKNIHGGGFAPLICYLCVRRAFEPYASESEVVHLNWHHDPPQPPSDPEFYSIALRVQCAAPNGQVHPAFL